MQECHLASRPKCKAWAGGARRAPIGAQGPCPVGVLLGPSGVQGPRAEQCPPVGRFGRQDPDGARFALHGAGTRHKCEPPACGRVALLPGDAGPRRFVCHR